MVMPIVEAVLQQILKANEGAYAGEDNPTLQTDGTWIYILFCHRGMCIGHCIERNKHPLEAGSSIGYQPIYIGGF